MLGTSGRGRWSHTRSVGRTEIGRLPVMTNLIIAIALCVAVAIAYAVAALIQARYAHLTVRQLVRVPVLWIAITLNGLGAALHVTSLNFGPLSLIQPLGVLTLVIAVPLAAITARRRATRLELTGTVATVIGLVGLALIIVTGGKADTLSTPELIWLIAATVVLVTVLGLLGRRPGASTLWEAIAGGMAFSVCSALCQTVVVTVDDAGAEALLRPISILAMIAIGTFAVVASILTQRSYRNGLSAPLAVTNLVNPASATVIGVVLLGEHLATTGLEIVLAVACGLLCAFGVAQLARARDVAATRPVQPSPPEDISPVNASASRS
jgi:drug/metabolite transporter (DMT)-like permease